MSSYLSSLGYPFRERPAVFFFGVMILWAMLLALWAPVIGVIANLFLMGYMCAFFMKMVQQSALGEDGICLFPDFESFFETIVMPYIRCIVCCVVSLLPLIIFGNMTDWGDDDFPGYDLVLWGTLVFPILYLPAAFMRTAVLESFSGLSLRAWWRMCRRMPWAYLGLVLCFCTGGLVLYLLPSGYLLNFAMVPVQLYIICVLMNICGRFMLKHEDAMGWDE